MVHPVLRRSAAAALLAASVAAMSGAAAGTSDAAPADARVAAARALFRPANAVDAGAPARPAGAGELDRWRGGTDTRNDMRLDATVAGNNAVNVVSGANRIDSGSFANMAGIPVVIQNSGANVLIQSATIINLQFK